MEYLPTVHEHTGELTGVILPRPEAIRDGAWCMSTNIFVMNSKGEILCHQRSLNKERVPGTWSTHLGGHVGSDETFETNAHKEVFEESGVEVKPEDLISWRTTKLPTARLWVKEFVVYIDQPVEAFTPQMGEVEKFAWMSPEMILSEQAKNPSAWLAGTHDFEIEHHCLRAALNVAHGAQKISIAPSLFTWAV